MYAIIMTIWLFSYYVVVLPLLKQQQQQQQQKVSQTDCFAAVVVIDENRIDNNSESYNVTHESLKVIKSLQHYNIKLL